jgi:hypothetical protein
MTDHDREAFEAAVKGRGEPGQLDFRRGANSEYADATTNTLYRLWLAALAHRDKQIADLQRQLDELVGAVMAGSRYSFDGDINRCRTCGTPLGVDCPNHCARALAARIKTTQPKESSDG